MEKISHDLHIWLKLLSNKNVASCRCATNGRPTVDGTKDLTVFLECVKFTCVKTNAPGYNFDILDVANLI